MLSKKDTNSTNIAQNHTQDMITNNFFAHTSPTTGMSPYDRINNSATYISVYPNPTSGVVYITTNDNAEEQIDIINQLGEIVYRTTIYGSTTLNLNNLNAGIYVLRTGHGYMQRIAKL